MSGKNDRSTGPASGDGPKFRKGAGRTPPTSTVKTMAETHDNHNMPANPLTGPGTGLSFSTLRRAALMLLLISAPAFFITLQMRRHDLRQAHGTQRLQQNISELRGITGPFLNGPSLDECGESTGLDRPLLRGARLDAVRPQVREKGLAVLLAPSHALAAASEALSTSGDPCGGV